MFLVIELNSGGQRTEGLAVRSAGIKLQQGKQRTASTAHAFITLRR